MDDRRLIVLVAAALLSLVAACGSVNIEATEVCVTGSLQCTPDNARIEQCGEDGTWLFLEECAFGEICDAATCIEMPGGGGGGGGGGGADLGGCGKPIIIDSEPFTDTDRQTVEVGAVSCGTDGDGAGEVAYFLDTNSGADVSVTVTADFDAVVYAVIPTGCTSSQPACSTGKCVAADGCAANKSFAASAGGDVTLQVTVPAEPGTVYIVVDGAEAGEFGTFSIEVSRD